MSTLSEHTSAHEDTSFHYLAARKARIRRNRKKLADRNFLDYKAMGQVAAKKTGTVTISAERARRLKTYSTATTSKALSGDMTYLH